MSGDITWLGSRTILYDGHVLHLADTNSGWEAMDAINEYEYEKQKKFDKAVQEAVQKELRKRGME